MARRIIFVDKQGFTSREEAKKFFLEGMMWSEGSERDRYAFAYECLCGGSKHINTYLEIAD